MKAFREITDQEWNSVEPLLPECRPQSNRDPRGRPMKNRRACMNATLFVMLTGVSWQMLPRKYPSYQTCHRCFKAWYDAGVMHKVANMLFSQDAPEFLALVAARVRIALRETRGGVDRAIKGKAAPDGVRGGSGDKAPRAPARPAAKPIVVKARARALPQPLSTPARKSPKVMKPVKAQKALAPSSKPSSSRTRQAKLATPQKASVNATPKSAPKPASKSGVKAMAKGAPGRVAKHATPAAPAARKTAVKSAARGAGVKAAKSKGSAKPLVAKRVENRGPGRNGATRERAAHADVVRLLAGATHATGTRQGHASAAPRRRKAVEKAVSERRGAKPIAA